MLQVIMAVLFGGGLFLLAGATRNRGWFVSDQVCTLGATFCDNPGWIVTIGIALVIVAAVNRIVQS